MAENSLNTMKNQKKDIDAMFDKVKKIEFNTTRVISNYLILVHHQFLSVFEIFKGGTLMCLRHNIH